MGKGIATAFKSKFGQVDELKAQNIGIGDVAILKVNSRYAYYLVTKERYFNKPTYPSLEQSLIAMRDHAVKNNVKTIAMPRIGCGLDALLWPRVTKMLLTVFNGTGIKIKVYAL